MRSDIALRALSAFRIRTAFGVLLASLAALTALVTVLVTALVTAPAPARAANPEPLTLRVNDGTAVPGGVLAVVLRTYSPRGVGQGQICFFGASNLNVPTPSLKGAAGGPLTELIEARVFSEEDDAFFSAHFDAATQELMLDFSSVSGSINRSDGPMVAFRFRVGDDVAPGTTFTLSVDPAMTTLVDAQGLPVAIEPRAGEMTIRSPLSSYEIDAEGGDAAGGEWSESGVATAESLPLSGGTVVFLYDPAVVSGTPEVRLAPRHGLATVDSVDLQPGRVAVTFSSPDLSLNTVPGNFLEIRLPIAPGVAVGDTSPVSLEGGTTQLLDADGLSVPLVLGGDDLLFVHRNELAMFHDGFESGDTGGWCAVVDGL